MEARDPGRGSRAFPCDIWCPKGRSAAPQPLIVFSHSSGGDRRQSVLRYACHHESLDRFRIFTIRYLVSTRVHEEPIHAGGTGQPIVSRIVEYGDAFA